MPTSMEMPAQVDATSAGAPNAPESVRLEVLSALVIAAFGVFTVVGARSIELRNETGGIDPRWWPTIIGAGIIFCGLWMLFNALTRRAIERNVQPANRMGWLWLLATIAALIGAVGIWIIGLHFLVITPLFLAVTNWFYGERRWQTLALFPTIVTLILFVIFRLLLKVPL
ncbi:tripartite tricarboxylate transporter TctB family protein [Schaalia sp. ZJ1691]|uniref:tripartite tricarboxylate transporter TctB family protein n=1 Tax=Schaalia sp. ZJ1691 TaxID=2709404 RepID=UPI0013EDC73D|nr:tripartite tricarboxylate transporter TctB family protein [Schaalia sp. ZJ1691]